MDGFIDIHTGSQNLDRYVIRTGIRNAAIQMVPRISGKVLDIGCGQMPYRSLITANPNVSDYIGLDLPSADYGPESTKPDLTWDGSTIPLNDNAIDTAIATEVLEHCFDPSILLKEAYRVLKPGGLFFFTTPFIWTLHEVPHDHYRYTPFSLQQHLANAGFSAIEIKPMGGWHASMAQMLGLWVRRSPMRSYQRRWLSWVIKPMMGYLLRKDKKLEWTFKDGVMVNALYGTARKPE